MEVNLKEVRPYGDTMDDGKVQLSFTLPLPADPRAREAARRLAVKMGLDEPQVVHMKDLGLNFTFFVVYGSCRYSLDVTKIDVPRVQAKKMDYYEINSYIEKNLGRKIVVVGACTGTDAHTVGLDAIMNMKGYAGEYGLERYPQFETYNLGSQVPNEELIAKAVEVDADAILVSQIVTQKNIHIENLTELVELLNAEGLRSKFLLVVGGPRITHELALELGFDAGFGTGTLPPDVAAYLAQEIVKRDQ